MKVHFLTENALVALKTNTKGNLRHYADDTNDWIYDYFGTDMPFMEYKQEFPDFELTINRDVTLAKNDVKNTITLYSAMKSLTDTQATDERLWAGMCHYDFWNYLKERWSVNDYHDIEENNVKSRYFFPRNKRDSLMRNSLSRLWWVGRLTYDETRTDPFELTKYLEKNFTGKALIIFSNNYVGNKNITIGLLSALKYLDDIGFKVKGKSSNDVYFFATKYLNVLGGTYILDYFSPEEIQEKIIKYMKSLKGATTSDITL